jgi:hypothetical protein
MRVLSRTVRHAANSSPFAYELTLEMAAPGPQSAGAACSGITADGDYHPLGGSGNTPNPSGGHVYYLRPGISYPETVTPGHQGVWHFPTYGAGGAGTVDYAAACTQNVMRCMVVGDGTMIVHTAEYTPAPVSGIIARLTHRTSDGVYAYDDVQTGVGGSDFTFAVSTHGGVNCTHWVDIRDQAEVCGTGWGFAGFEWVGS